MSPRTVVLFASALAVTSVHAADPFTRFFLQQSKYTGNGVPVSEAEVFIPTVAEDGTFTIPVTATKDAKLPWTFEGAFSPEPIELGKARGLSFTGLDAKSQGLASPGNGVGVANSFYFPLTGKMKTLTFQIAGTNSFSGAYAELLIDGKSMFRQSPESIAKLTTISWDLSKYADEKAPKLARLRLVDRESGAVISSMPPQPTRRESSSESQLILLPIGGIPADSGAIESGPSLRSFGISSPKFLDSVNPNVRIAESSTQPMFDFSVPIALLRKLRNSALSVGRRTPHLPTSSPGAVGERIKSQILQEVSGIDGSLRANQFLVDYLLASAICEYAFSHIVFDDQGMRTNPDLTSQQQERPFEIFSWPVPKATCAGYSKIVCEMSNSVGVKCSVVNGICRWLDGPTNAEDNHSWVVFEFKNGSRIPADVTPMFPDRILRNSKAMMIYNWQSLPVTARSWELFMAMHWFSKVRWTPTGEFMDAGKKRVADQGQTNPNVDLTFYRLTKQEWVNLDSSNYEKLLSWYSRYCYGP